MLSAARRFCYEVGRARLEQALLLEVVGLPTQSIKVAAGHGGIGVADDDIQAGHREYLGDAPAHISGTDYGDVLNLYGHV
jgi:hypothetical protein